MPTHEKNPSQLLEAHLQGEPAASEELIPLIYDELRAIAKRQMRGERNDHTLQPTALANEALLRLVKHEKLAEEGRTAFLRIAARAMRRVLVSHARARNAKKRLGEANQITLLEPAAQGGSDPIDILALDEALTRLGRLSERQAQVVEYKFFGGLTLKEAAAEMEIAESTAKDHWTLAKAWLNRELSKGEES